MTYTSIKAQLTGVTDKELSKQTLLNDYISEDNLTIYTVLRSVSASGMTRHISLKFVQDNNIYDITYLAAEAMGERLSDRNGYNTIKVSGTGMDMGFHLVYELSSVLFHGQERAGYKLSQRWL
jgi:hypothetical protein